MSGGLELVNLHETSEFLSSGNMIPIFIILMITQLFYDKQMGDDELEATEEIQMGNDADGKSVVTGGHGGQQWSWRIEPQDAECKEEAKALGLGSRLLADRRT